MTGSMAYAMQPKADAPKEVNSISSVQASPEPTETQTTATQTTETAPVAPVAEPKVVTWQDNPNNCNQDTQYISQDAPFNCIDKPVQNTPPANASSSTVASYQAGDWVGQCYAWAAQAGVPMDAAGIALINKESKCDPNAVNPSSGACGIGQQLPCGKWAGAWNDPVASLQGMWSYVQARYQGSWAVALAFHNAHNWY